MYNYAMTTRPPQAMWWAEMAIFLAVAAVTFTGIVALRGSAANQGRHVTLDGGASILLIALSAGVGIFVSGRFRAWGLRRQAVPFTRS
ncbi:hypothetical protein ACN6LA_001647 [Streptomyces sp. SAS_269]|uniref:hypothetical protein n=1 Tax=Streptomyces sp. SAS_269 TaxID=3412749 RepID=UPI00403D1700